MSDYCAFLPRGYWEVLLSTTSITLCLERASRRGLNWIQVSSLSDKLTSLLFGCNFYSDYLFDSNDTAFQVHFCCSPFIFAVEEFFELWQEHCAQVQVPQGAAMYSTRCRVTEGSQNVNISISTTTSSAQKRERETDWLIDWLNFISQQGLVVAVSYTHLTLPTSSYV